MVSDAVAVEIETPELAVEEAEERARLEIRERVIALNPYRFQALVVALLRGMGYHTPFVAAPGPDGGFDILAYRDPLGTGTPHVKVQVKHRRDTKASREEIASLRGVVRSDREVGMFVSSAGFTSQAINEARGGAVHIELMDLDRLLSLWVEFYERVPEQDREILRLRKVYFLAPDE